MTTGYETIGGAEPATEHEPRIAIIGSGPGGLTCARILQQAGASVAIYERDADAHARDQGGTLDMQVETGQKALRAAGLLDEFMATARPEGQDMKALDKDGNVLMAHIAEPGELDSPEMDRSDLRDLLLASLKPDTIQYGMSFESATPKGNGVHELLFADGTSTEVDLVVGADGAWSRVRPLLSAERPSYEGVMFIEVHFQDVDETHPGIAELVGNGGMFAMQDNKALIAQRQSRERIRTYVAFRGGVDWAAEAGIDAKDATAVRTFLLEKFDDWSPELRSLLTDCDDEFIARPMYSLPVPHVWNTRAGVTILGDAAHLMSPFSGLGANTAMLDGADLAEAILSSPDLLTAVAAYESTMLPRAAINAAGAHEGLQGALVDGLPDMPGDPDQS